MDLIAKIESEEMVRLARADDPQFGAGDTVAVSVRVQEGATSRLQLFEGVCIAKRNRGLNTSFIVRKISSGEGVERTFQLYSPIIKKIKVVRFGHVNRSKIYYLRQRSGKSARIRERLGSKRKNGAN